MFFKSHFVLRWSSVVDGMLKFKNCAGAEDIQSVDYEHNMTDSWWTASAVNTADTEGTDGGWPTEQYTPWTLQTLNWHWTLIDSEPNWQLSTRLNTTDTE